MASFRELIGFGERNDEPAVAVAAEQAAPAQHAAYYDAQVVEDLQRDMAAIAVNPLFRVPQREQLGYEVAAPEIQAPQFQANQWAGQANAHNFRPDQIHFGREGYPDVPQPAAELNFPQPWEFAFNQRVFPPNDLVVKLSAVDIEKIANRVIDLLEEREAE